MGGEPRLLPAGHSGPVGWSVSLQGSVLSANGWLTLYFLMDQCSEHLCPTLSRFFMHPVPCELSQTP